MKKRHFLPLPGAVAGSFPGSWLVVWSIAGWLAVMGAVQGQEKGLKFRHLSTADGLSHSSITHILQDRQGYMWIATEDGLDRYDGYQFTSFAAQPAGKGSVSGSWVSPQRLFEDRSGGIWVSFASGGAARYNPATEAFVHYFHDPARPRGLSHDKVTCFYQGPSGTLWLGTQEGLNRYVPATGSFRQYFLEKNAKGPANQITRMLEDRQGRLWVGTQYGLYLLDPDTGTARAFYPNPAQPKLSNSPNWHNWITELYEDRRGRFWVGTHRSGLLRLITESPGGAAAFAFSPCRQEGLQHTLITFLRETGRGDLWVGTNRGVVRLRESPQEGQRVERYLHETSLLDKYDHHRAQYFYEDRRGHIWVAFPKHLFRFDPDRNGFSPVLHNPNDPGSLSSNAVTSMYEDRAGVLWFGTLKGGLNLLNTRRKPFHHFRHLPGNSNSLDHPDVYSIREDRQGVLWIGTYSGLNRYDPVTGRFALYRRTPAGQKTPQPETVGVIAEDTTGFLWIGYYDGQLARFFPGSKKFISHDHHSHQPGSNLSWSIRALHQDRDGHWWIGACTAGLGRWHPRTNTFAYYMPDTSSYLNSGVSVNPSRTINDVYIRALYEDKQEIVWIGTLAGGLNRFDRRQGTFRRYLHNPRNRHSISSNTVNAIYEDDAGRLWVGTTSGGLNLFDRRTETFRHYTTAEGLPSNTVYGILDDGKGCLWLSTNRGLCRFNPQTETFRNFYQADGLQSNEFNPGAYFRSPGGLMYFGGTNGVTAFHPDSITDNPQAPRTLITSFSIFNQPLTAGTLRHGKAVLSRPISQTRAITLSHADNTFSLGFVGLDYAAPDHPRYAYQLAGFRPEWTYADASQRVATYTNLSPGQYTFRVKAANSDGAWSPCASLRITITPPFWATWWFRTAWAMGILAGLGLIYRTRTDHLRQQKQRLEKEVASRTQEVMQQKEEIRVQRDHLQVQFKNIRVLSEVGQKITASIRLEDIFETVYGHVNEWMEAPAFGIGLVNQHDQSVEYLTKTGPGQVTTRDLLRLDDPERLSVWCIRHGQIVYLNQVAHQIGKYLYPHEGRYTRAESPKSLIYLPLRNHEERVIGILVVKCFRERAYSEVHLNLLKNLASYITIALDNASAYRSMLGQKEQIERMAQRVHEADQQKLRFFTNVSHEFRTPLTLIVSPLERLLAAPGRPEENTHTLHELMHRNAQRLLRLIDQLTEWQKLEEGIEKLRLESGDLGGFVQELAGQFREIAAEYGLGLMIDAAPLEGWFDRDKVEKIMYNLISNALKNTPAGGRVTVSVAPGAPDHALEPGFVLRVADTGLGISPDHLPHIFDLFYNVENRHAAFPRGLGIGLALTRQMAALHLGQIAVESEVNKGTVFTVYLPARYAADLLPGENPPQTTDQNVLQFTVTGLQTEGFSGLATGGPAREPTAEPPGSILLIEDNPDIRAFVKLQLEGRYQVTEAKDGEEGLEAALTYLPDLILSDVRMPRMDGFRVCQRVKTDERTSHIPVILLTARHGETAHLQGLETGADDYVGKPFSVAVLEARIRNLIHSRRHLRERFAAASHEEIPRLGSNPTERRFMEKTIRIIDTHLGSPGLDGDFLSLQLGMSRTNLYRKLKSTSGLPADLFIRSIRLKKAACLLRQEGQTVAEVARTVGFVDPVFFSRCFIEQYGQSPAQYADRSPEK